MSHDGPVLGEQAPGDDRLRVSIFRRGQFDLQTGIRSRLPSTGKSSGTDGWSYEGIGEAFEGINVRGHVCPRMMIRTAFRTRATSSRLTNRWRSLAPGPRTGFQRSAFDGALHEPASGQP